MYSALGKRAATSRLSKCEKLLTYALKEERNTDSVKEFYSLVIRIMKVCLKRFVAWRNSF